MLKISTSAWVCVVAVFAAAQGGARGELPSPSGNNVDREWLSPVEVSGFHTTPSYAETVAFCRRLAAASPWIEYRTFGVSPQGRDLPLVIVSSDGAFTPRQAQETGKLIVLVQNCIHAGECGGKDASLMLLRDIVITKTRRHLLDNVILVVIPIFSVDGHERFSPYSRINQNGPDQMGWRVTSRNLNLNRDYVKADAVEMRAWLTVWNTWKPDLHIDNHTTDGGDWQYDVTFAVDTHGAAAPQISDWLKDNLVSQLLSAMEKQGHVPAIYFSLVDSKDPAKGIRSGGFSPRYSTGYAAIRNRPSILVETHMLKPYRTRVIGHYNLMLDTLKILNRNPESLRRAVRSADEAVVAAGRAYDPEASLPVAISRGDSSVPFRFKGFAYRRELSDISGDVRIVYDNSKPIEIDTVWYNETSVTREVNPPLAYIIPPEWTEVIELVHAHGLQAERTTRELTLEIQSYLFSEVTFPKRSYEGRFQPKFKSERIVEERRFPSGSIVVPLAQADAKVAIHMLEPDAPDSLVAWGFFHAIFERKEYGEHYVLENLARKMLEDDPELRVEFENRIREDRDFASNSWSRLNFFYQHSPYWDEYMNRYPVGRITAPLPKASTEPVRIAP